MKKQNGMALPVVLVFLAIFSFLGLALISRFSGTGAKEALEIQTNNQKYGSAIAGIERMQFELVRPDSPGHAYHWTANNSRTNTFTLDNSEKVTVTVEDITSP